MLSSPDRAGYLAHVAAQQRCFTAMLDAQQKAAR
jgi:hypothetical protein